jgi:DNA-binding MarR family transcriptional regulator
MENGMPPELISEFLGSVYIFADILGQVIEEGLWKQASGDSLSVSQLKLLKLVSCSGTHTITDVGTFLGISNAAASKAVDKLVRRMLLRRAEGEADRRAAHLSLTGAGRRLLESYDQILLRKLAEVFVGFPASELKQVVSLLDRLSVHMIDPHARADRVCVQCGIYFRGDCLLRRELDRKCLFQK